MKIIIYIVSFMGLFLTLQSCDRFSSLLGDDVSQQKQVVDNQKQGISGNEQEPNMTDQATTAQMQSQLQQNEDGIRQINDSLNILNSNLSNLQSRMASLEQRLAIVENDKIGVKNLFVYLVIYSIIVIVLVIFLVKKKAIKDSMTEKQVKDIIADFAKRHPEIINGSVQLTLHQHLGYIQNHKQAIDAINVQLGALVNSFNGLTKETPNPESREKQVASCGQQGQKKVLADGTGGVFYMKRPLNEMEFDLSLRRETPTEETLYRFELDGNSPNIAHFVFDCNSPSRVRWALSTKDKTLDRVCNASGSGTNGEYKCTTKGEAELRDGKWVVTRKAVVIFN